MGAGIRSSLAALAAILLAHVALAQEQRPELTPAGKAIFSSFLAADGRPIPFHPVNPAIFPLAACTFRGGLCGAVRRDGSVAVPPRYDWVGQFSDRRAAVRLGGLYGFVDEDGREVVKPQYALVGDFKFGFAQVEVNGKVGLIDRDGRMVVEPKYEFIQAISPDRFGVSDKRQVWGPKGGEVFHEDRQEFVYAADGRSVISTIWAMTRITAAIDRSGQVLEQLSPPDTSGAFDRDDPSIRWVQRDKLWGLQRADGTWLVEPRFQEAHALTGGLARVTLNGKVGFIDRTGGFAIAPVFDKAGSFLPGFDRTSAARDGVFGVIDRSGAWVFRTNYQEVRFATVSGESPTSPIVKGWHFKRADRWGLLDLDGRVVLDADFDRPVGFCDDRTLVAAKEGSQLYFKHDGTPLQPPNGRIVDYSCDGTPTPPFALRVGDKYGLVDADGTALTPVHFDAVSWVREGANTKNVKIGGKWGRIGGDGRWLIEPKFDYLSRGVDPFVAAVDGKRGVMRADGTWLIEPRFDAVALRSRDAGTAFVTVSGATGILRLSDQSWVIPLRPGIMCDIYNAVMSQADGKQIMLSPAGETWIDIGAERVDTYLQIGLLSFLKGGKWGLIDTAGQVMVEPQFDELDGFVRGIAWAKRGERWCAIDRRGRDVPSIACTGAVPVDLGRGRSPCKVEP